MKQVFNIIILLVFVFKANAEEIKPVILKEKDKLRIKLENNEPVSYVDKELVIYYPSSQSVNYLPTHTIYLSAFDELLNISGYTLIPQKNGNMKKVYVTFMTEKNSNDNNIFIDDSKEITMALPQLKAGAKAYIQYTIRTEELHAIHPFYFQSFLQCDTSIFEIIYPDNFSLQSVEKNFSESKISFEEEKTKNITKLIYKSINNKAIDVYDDAPSISYYAPHVIPILNKIKVNDKWVSFLSSPSDLFNWYKSLFDEDTQPSKELLDIAAKIKSESNNQFEVTEKSYDWVKKNIHYIANEAGIGGLVPRKPNDVLQKKYGDCKDMSNLLKSLLNINHVEASLVWIGTRKIPYTYDEMYTKNNDNHMIVAFKENKKWIYLDATDPNGVFGLPTTHIQGKQAMIDLNKNDFILSTVPVVEAKENRLNQKIEFTLKGTDLNAKLMTTATGFVANSYNNVWLYHNENEKEKFIKNLIDDDHLSIKSFDYNSENSNSTTIKTEALINDRVRIIDQNIIVNPHIYSNAEWATIETENRTVDKEIDYNRMYQTNAKMTVPKGYKLTQLPKNFVYESKNFKYKITYKKTATAIEWEEIIMINVPSLIIPYQEFSSYNDFISTINQSYKQSFNFKKI